MANESSPDAHKIHITPEDVDIIVQKATSNSCTKVLDYKLVNQSGDINGLLATYFILEVKIQRPDTKNQETLNCFVKSMPSDDGAKTLVDDLSLFHREIFFFNEIVPLFTSNYDIKKWAPTCFMAKGNEIVMEELKSKGYQVCHKLFDNYDLLKSAVVAVANFHSGSILAEAHLNRDLQHPIPLNERFPDIVKETQFSNSEFTKSWIDSGVVATGNIAKLIGKDSEDVTKKFSRIPDIIKPTKKYCNVILHGDLWTNNIMFDEAKPLPNCILIDFQITRYGPLVFDLLQLLHLNASPAFRAKFEKELVDHYHSTLQDTLSRNDPLVSIPTREEINLGLQEYRIFGSLLSCLYFPTSVLDPKILTKIANNETAFKDILANDRTGFILKNFEIDEGYKTKIIEAVTELSEIN